MIKTAIAKVVEGRNLSEQEAHDVVLEIMEGRATPAQIAALLTALRMKGETVEEITGAARVMREKAAHIEAQDPSVVDTCGTGGDRSGTFNISTTAALVVAGAGLTVAKHGNRSVSSACGSADVLQALGVNIDLEPKEVEACLNAVGIAFLFAPRFHGAMKHAIGPRKEIAIRTLFNILGPLTNPADAKIQVLGVYDHALTEPMAMVLGNLGAHRAFVVHGSDGLDEITVTGPTRLSEWAQGRVATYDLEPRDFGIARGRLKDLEGGDAETNARITQAILGGEPGPKRDIVVLNAAAALVAAEKVKDFAEGLTMAREVIDSGRALEKLEALRRFTHAPQHA